MTKIQFSKNNLLAILAGLVTIIVLGIITSTVSVFMTSRFLHTIPVRDIESALTSFPYLAIIWTRRVISFLALVIGGYIVGIKVSKNGWVYGGILGIIVNLISIGIASLAFIFYINIDFGPNFPTNYGSTLTLDNILSQIYHAPLILILTSLGGYWGGRSKKTIT